MGSTCEAPAGVIKRRGHAGCTLRFELASREGLIGPANQPKTGNGGQDDVAPTGGNNRADRSSREMRLELEDPT